MTNKAALIQKIIASLDAELALLAQSARAAHAEATHEQSRAENKYDTRGLEASYLARGQSKQAAETLQARAEYEALTPRSFSAADGIDLCAVVELAGPGGNALYFIGPRAGGTAIIHQKKTLLVMTPQSPLGSALVGRKKGERLLIEIGGTPSAYRIAKVF
ncbi:MAG: transcription elongation factor GreAB [Verrucomicrobia bacterium]|nr:transcription elongation factor GreAB [Verrucomicrobiota bacterium]